MKLRSTVPALAIAGLLVLALDPAGVSAAAKNLVLGKTNKESKTTTLQNTGSGAALSLKAKAGQPALKVNSTTKVAKLNADKVDGMDASALGTSATVWTMAVPQATENVGFALPLAPGHYLVSYSAYLKGGENTSADCYLSQLVGGVQRYVAESKFDAGASTPGLSATGVVEQSADGTVALYCYSGAPFTTWDNEPIQIVATPITTFTDGGAVSPNIRPAPRPAHR